MAQLINIGCLLCSAFHARATAVTGSVSDLTELQDSTSGKYKCPMKTATLKKINKRWQRKEHFRKLGTSPWLTSLEQERCISYTVSQAGVCQEIPGERRVMRKC